jgi:RimJ/RimL family protein N-acetyltransferase
LRGLDDPGEDRAPRIQLLGTPMPWPDPVSLSGSCAALVPLSHEHAGELAEAVADGDLHRLWYTSVPAPDGVPAEVTRRLALRAEGRMLPFAVIDRASGCAVGMTTYMNIDAANRRVEIGSTWYRASVQRTGLNTECKYLLLRHAFEALDCIAVEFRTHVMNRQSRRAIERLGAKLDGILRAHMVLPNGTLRDTCVYSVTAAEWPAVRANLEALMVLPR